MKSIIFTVAFAALFVGCSTKVPIKSLKPAKVQEISSYKTLSTLPFKNDKQALEDKIVTDLSSFRIQGKNYFTVIERDKTKIYDEHKLRESGLYGSNLANEGGELKGAKAFIGGSVLHNNSTDSYFREERQRCADKECSSTVKYTVSCTKRVGAAEALIKIIDIKTAKLVYSKVYKSYKSWSKCSDQNSPLPSRGVIAGTLVSNISHQFLQDVTPSYNNFNVTILEDPDIDYSDENEELLEKAVEDIEKGRYDRAEQTLQKLVIKTQRQSYVPMYNLGILKERKGNFKEALGHYNLAQKVAKKDVEEIQDGIRRALKLQKDKERAMKEINKQ